MVGLEFPDEVVFTTSLDVSEYPLPNPKYLAIHAACCTVANLSGAADYLHKAYQYMEELHVLSEDGGSSSLLAVILHKRLIADI